ncbi:MAG: hypothetical protein QGH20_05780 [Candidatus Latescibacteria bacterium]|nr:hypothetical protein [Candidatus Latescibacterota bacterium]
MAYELRKSGTTGATAWLFQRLSGMVLVLLTIGHFVLMHMDTASGHTYTAVVSRLSGPFGVWYKAGYFTFVVLGLYHGLNGIYNIIRDFKLSSGWNLTAISVLIITGIAFGAMGFTTILHFNAPVLNLVGN